MSDDQCTMNVGGGMHFASLAQAVSTLTAIAKSPLEVPDDIRVECLAGARGILEMLNKDLTIWKQS